jgi:hypothetical protein
MEKLNVRFEDSTSELIGELSGKFNETSSKVARDAMAIGLGVMTSEGKYVKPEEFLKRVEE